MPSQQAYPYVTHTHTIASESEDDAGIAQLNFGNTLVQHGCRNLTDMQAHEAVMNKTWFQKVAEHDAQRLQQRMVSAQDPPRLPQRLSSSRSLSMTIPAWASKKLQSEAALWSQKKDIGHGPASSSVSPTPTEEEFKYPLHEMLTPSLEHVEAFLSDEPKEPEQTSRDSLTMSWHMPSPESDSSSSTQLRPSPDELARLKAQRKKDDEEVCAYVGRSQG